MKFTKINTLLIGTAFALAISSCEEPAESDSIKTTFSPYSAALTTAPIATTECGNVYTLDFTFDNNQNTDITLLVSAGESSIAKEGEDFELLTHEIDIPAYAGQDTFSVDIAVFQDFEIEEGGTEPIYLTFKSETPSGVSLDDVLVAEITDSGIGVEAADSANFELSWAYTDGLPGDPCNHDLDLTVQTAGSAPYGDDLLGFGAASLACVEAGTLYVEDMNEGEVYDIWVFIYASDAVARDLTISVDYDRGNSTLSGTLTVDGVFNSAMAADGFIVGTIEKNCNIVTIKDPDGNVVAEGRVKGNSPILKSVHNVKKRI
jgi:hypothetical protein